MNHDLYSVTQDQVQAFFDDLHTAMPGIIKSYDAVHKTANVQPAVKMLDDAGIYIQQPLIINCPVYFPGTSDMVLQYPLKDGDKCLLIFSERSLENWMLQGGAECDDAGDPRRFSLTDGFCLPGIFAPSAPGKVGKNTGLELLYKDLALLMNDDGSLEIKGSSPGDIKIGANGNISLNGNTKAFVTHAELNAALQTFITALMLHVHTSAAPNSPTTPPTTPITLDISAAATTTIKTGG